MGRMPECREAQGCARATTCTFLYVGRRVKRIKAKDHWTFALLNGFAKDGEPRVQNIGVIREDGAWRVTPATVLSPHEYRFEWSINRYAQATSALPANQRHD